MKASFLKELEVVASSFRLEWHYTTKEKDVWVAGAEKRRRLSDSGSEWAITAIPDEQARGRRLSHSAAAAVEVAQAQHEEGSQAQTQ